MYANGMVMTHKYSGLGFKGYAVVFVFCMLLASMMGAA